MRQLPSRLMPKVPEPVYISKWAGVVFFLFIPAFLLSIPLQTAFPVIIGYVALFYMLAIATNRLHLRELEHFAKMVEERKGESICTFVRKIDFHHIDTWVIRAVYEEIQSHLAYLSPKFPLRPTDHIMDDFKIDGDDFDMDIVSNIAKRTGRTFENYKSNPYYHNALTVGGLIAFFNAQPKTA
jgi:hypothetical protein